MSGIGCYFDPSGTGDDAASLADSTVALRAALAPWHRPPCRDVLRVRGRSQHHPPGSREDALGDPVGALAPV